jgi:8-oxo-dGTP pyrophosphatase MutT (NUDIX family)
MRGHATDRHIRRDLASAATQSLRRLLDVHEPADEQEAADLATMQQFLLSAAHPFSREQPGAHFTASALVLAPDDGGVALLHHRKLQRLLQPGGHFEEVDAGEPLAAAMREAEEELGAPAAPALPWLLDVDVHAIPASGDVALHLHLDLRFLLRAPSFRLEADPAETGGARWYSWEELATLELDPPLRRALAKAAAVTGRATPL